MYDKEKTCLVRFANGSGFNVLVALSVELS